MGRPCRGKPKVKGKCAREKAKKARAAVASTSGTPVLRCSAGAGKEPPVGVRTGRKYMAPLTLRRFPLMSVVRLAVVLPAPTGI